MNDSRFIEVLLAVFFGLWLFALSLVAVLKITDTHTTLYYSNTSTSSSTR